jgi:hypothetical protein
MPLDRAGQTAGLRDDPISRGLHERRAKKEAGRSFSWSIRLSREIAQEKPEDNEGHRENYEQFQSATQAFSLIRAPRPKRPAAGIAPSMRSCHFRCGGLQTIEATATLSATVRFPTEDAMKYINRVRLTG